MRCLFKPRTWCRFFRFEDPEMELQYKEQERYFMSRAFTVWCLFMLTVFLLLVGSYSAYKKVASMIPYIVITITLGLLLLLNIFVPKCKMVLSQIIPVICLVLVVYLNYNVHATLSPYSYDELAPVVPKTWELIKADPSAVGELDSLLRLVVSYDLWYATLLLEFLFIDALRLTGASPYSWVVHLSPLICLLAVAYLSPAVPTKISTPAVCAAVGCCYTFVSCLHNMMMSRQRFKLDYQLKQTLEKEAAALARAKEAEALQRQIAQKADSMLNHMLKNIMADAAGSIDLFMDKEGPSPTEHLVRAQQCLDKGMRWCKKRQIMIQVAKGDYIPSLVPTSLPLFASFLAQGRQMTATADPLIAHLDVMLCELVLDNALANAFRHGDPTDPAVRLDIFGANLEGRQYVHFRIRNRARSDRPSLSSDIIAKARTGELTPDQVFAPSWGCQPPALSDRLGLQHVLMAAEAHGMSVNLIQEGEIVIFSAALPTPYANSMSEDERLNRLHSTTDGPFPSGLTILCIDDSDVARRLLQHVLTKAAGGCVIKVMGASVSDVERFEEEALKGADILVLDQNLVYPSGTVFGTDIVRRLLDNGYSGLIAIRSANDSEEDHQMFLTSGANVVLGKDVPAKDLATRLRVAYHEHVRTARQPRVVEESAPTAIPTIPSCLSHADIALIPTDYTTTAPVRSDSPGFLASLLSLGHRRLPVTPLPHATSQQEALTV